MAEEKPKLTRSNSPLSHPAFAQRFPKAAEEADAKAQPNPANVADRILSGPCALQGLLNYAAPMKVDHVSTLREAVEVEDWGKAFAEGRATCHAQASWSASPDRCSFYQMLCGVHGAKAVLEIGSFCGTAALAIALALPDNGSVVSLEFDPYFVEFGQRYTSQSEASRKMKTLTGPALDNLEALADEVKKGSRAPFDIAIIDADKSHMKDYFDFLFEKGLLTERPVVCVDTTPFKGQIPLRYQRFGMADKVTPPDSGEQNIIAFAKAIKEMPGLTASELGGMLVLQKGRA
jgi:predicted O-methyltransferase YrrM